MKTRNCERTSVCNIVFMQVGRPQSNLTDDITGILLHQLWIFINHIAQTGSYDVEYKYIMSSIDTVDSEMVQKIQNMPKARVALRSTSQIPKNLDLAALIRELGDVELQGDISSIVPKGSQLYGTQAPNKNSSRF